MEGLGQQLRLARESKNLLIDEAAEQIHIRTQYLTALEDEAWSVFKDPIYARGFLRTYAHFLDLGAEAFVAQFNELAPSSIRLLGPEEEMPRPARPHAAWVVGASVAALAVLSAGWNYFVVRPAAEPAVTASAAPVTALPTAAVSPAVSLPAPSGAIPATALPASTGSPAVSQKEERPSGVRGR